LVRHPNYVGTPKQAHHTPIAQNSLKREKNRQNYIIGHLSYFFCNIVALYLLFITI
jgi:hypothetical protein